MLFTGMSGTMTLNTLNTLKDPENLAKKDPRRLQDPQSTTPLYPYPYCLRHIWPFPHTTQSVCSAQSYVSCL